MALYTVDFQRRQMWGNKPGAALVMANSGREAEQIVRRIGGITPDTVQAKEMRDAVLLIDEGTVLDRPEPLPLEKATEGLSKEPKTF